jgi:hypothetical protein
MSVFNKLGHYGVKVVEFLTDEPREANTEGGIFPAIFWYCFNGANDVSYRDAIWGNRSGVFA